MPFSRRAVIGGLAASVAALPALAAGSAAPPKGLRTLPRPSAMLDVSVRGPDGGEAAFYDLRGKPVLAVFWATWCVICYDEMPKLQALQARLGEKVHILPISIDEGGMPVVRRYMERRGLKGLTPYHDPNGIVFDMLGGRSVPTGVVIDAAGRRRALSLGRVDWDSDAAADYLTSL